MARSRALAVRRVYVRAKRRAHARKFTVPVAVVAGFTPLLYSMYRGAVSSDPNYGGVKGALREGAQQFGIDPMTGGSINFSQTLRGLSPIIGGIVIHKLAQKLGINRAIAQAGIPFVRV